MLEPKQAKKIPFEKLDSETQQYYHDLFKKYVVRQQIADLNKDLTALFIKTTKSANPKDYSKGFNQFNNYFANSNLISQLSYDESCTGFLRNMTKDQFNAYLKRNGGSFARKIALICYSSRPTERIANRLNFETMQAYANMQHYVLSHSKSQTKDSLDKLFSDASKQIRHDFEQTYSYSYLNSPISSDTFDYKSVGKKCADIWKSMLIYYFKEIQNMSPIDAVDFISQNFIFTELDRKSYFNLLEKIPEIAKTKLNEHKLIAENNARTMPDFYDVSDYNEVYSKHFEDVIFSETTIETICSVLHKYLDLPAFEKTQNTSKSK